MSETLPILVNQTLAMFIMMGMGFALFKLRLINDDGMAQMSNLVLYVISPAIVIQSFVTTEFSIERLEAAGLCFVLSLLVLGVSAVLVRLVYGTEEPVSKFAVVFSNMGFIGIPLVTSVLGAEYVFYLSCVMAAFAVFVWTYGAWVVSGDANEVSSTKVLTNPNMIALAVSIVLFCLSVRLPTPVVSVLSNFSSVNTGLSMTVLGGYLAQADIRGIAGSAKTYKACLLRLVAVPLLAIALFVPFPWLDAHVKTVLIIAFSTPVAGMLAMFSQKFGKDFEYAGGLVAFSTLLSLVSMPLMIELGIVLM